MSDILYKKVGRSYKPVGIEFTGFPANGVWFVFDGKNSLIVPLDHPNPIERVKLGIHREKIVEVLNNKFNKQKGNPYGYSIYNLVDLVMDSIIELNEEEIKKYHERKF